jgi:TorA maturation chaperone TorD
LGKTVDTEAAVERREDPAEKTIGRSNLYGFLALIFREEPTAALLRQIKSAQFSDALSSAGVKLDDDFLASPDEELLDDLALEYTRLFVGPGKHIPPSEGAQREGALWGKSTSHVASFVETCGFQYRPEFNDLPDHISVELEFMREVTLREAAAWKEQDRSAARHWLQIESNFIGKHLSRWVPRFCEKISQEAESSFYREMAVLTDSFIQGEYKEIKHQLENGKDTGWYVDPLDTLGPLATADPPG